jgi:hypothetical protein
MRDPNQPHTKSIEIAATFMALGAIYDGADKTNPKQMIFYFLPPVSDDEDAQPFDFEKVERLYTAGVLLGNLKSGFRAYQDLKSVVHSG